ncbi:MAG TPA: extracellular solute-binding protein [Firmicutes bacterium]|nr:extracellular solute-binding protein [Bacillota bacterium]
MMALLCKAVKAERKSEKRRSSRNLTNSITAGLLAVCFLAGAVLPAGAADAGPAEAAASDRAAGTGQPEADDVPDYPDYLAAYASAPLPGESLLLTAGQVSAQADSRRLSGYLGYDGEAVLTEEGGYVEYAFTVEQAGLYTLAVDFCVPDGRRTAAERDILINGELPFSEAAAVVFKRRWANETPIGQDTAGNDIRPVQTEEEGWQHRLLTDSMGYYPEPLLFYFHEGVNTLRFSAEREPLVLGDILLAPPAGLPAYAALAEAYRAAGYADGTQEPIVLQGETADLKSDQTLAPAADRSSPATVPSSPSKIRLNIIGGESWSQTGQFVTWEFDVEQAGLYTIAVKWRQNIQRGLTSVRRIYLDGEVPCAELNQVEFPYAGGWNLDVLGDGETEYRFYLAEGRHTITLEATLGAMGDIARRAQESVTELNRIYRRILMVTGSTPDGNRDYHFEDLIPDDLQALAEQAAELEALCGEVERITGSRGANVASVATLARQCGELSRRPEKIAKGFSIFKTNLGALGTWIMNISSQPLEIDFLQIQPAGTPLPRADATFPEAVWHELQMFACSFVEDYNTVADTAAVDEYRNETPLRIWITNGRDQAQIIKGILDDTFTPRTGIRTKIELVQEAAMLPATVAGRGPDVVLSTADNTPVNYALRGAVADLTRFEGFEEAAARFYPDALVPYEYNGGVYALPVTRTFPVMFYRRDVLADLGLDVPQTWEDVVNMVPVLAQNNMAFTLPVSTTSTPGAGVGSYYMFLFQHGGQVYRDGGMACDLDSEAGSAAFKEWTNYYINYEFPLTYDFVNRFRLGETPIGIADLGTYNNLMVSAPEIKGLWDFTLVPGTRREDGTIDRSVASSGTACMLFASCTQQELGWEVLDWWTSAETQTRFGSEMESLLGASARYATANREAFSQLAWSVKEYDTIERQRAWAQGVPEVPGGYFTSRHLDNAFRRVTYYWEDPRDTLTDYVYVINQEIAGKREEFGLPYQEQTRGGEA